MPSYVFDPPPTPAVPIADEDAFFPVTLGDFVKVYENGAR